MRVALTGASGLLGGNLAIALCQRGDTVVATRRAGSRVQHLDAFPITWVEADLDDPKALTAAFAGCEQVFHVAAAVSVVRRVTPTLYAANVEGTRNVVTAVRAAGVRRLVHTSTVSAVGLSTDGNPCTESAPWNFPDQGLADGYATTKHEAELVVRQAVAEGLDAVIVNPTYMFGPYDARPSSGKMILEVLQGKVPSLPSGANNFVDVRDVVRGKLLAAERGRSGERYILGGQNLPYAEIWRRIAAVGGGVKLPTLRLPYWLVVPVGWVGDLQERLSGKEPMINSMTLRYGYSTSFQFSSAKAEAELGYRPGPIEPAIADAIAWFRGRGMV
jgi:dihydroflavonol-4-reductase